MTKDAYTWAAHYTDGTSIREFDRPDGHGFAVVESDRVKHLALESGPQAHVVTIPENATPVFFRRRTIGLLDGGRSTTHCIGWKREEQAVYLFILDDGSTLLTDDLQAV